MKKYLLLLSCLITFPVHTYAATAYDHDFNDQTFGTTAGSFWSIQNSGGIGGSAYARCTYSTAGTAGKAIIIPVSSYASNTIWIEFYARASSNISGGSKFTKIFGYDQADSGSDEANNLTLGLLYEANVNRRVAYFGDTACTAAWAGGNSYNTAKPEQLVCANVQHPVTGGDIDIRGTSWHHYKAMVKRANPGQTNGEIKVWWNGNLHAHLTNMPSNPSHSITSPYLKRIEIGGYNDSRYFNGSTWYLDIDNLYVGTTEKGSVPETTHTLTVSKNGTGTGTVASSPSGITCGSNCSANYTANSNVILSFISDTGSTISSVSGCTLSGNQCTVNMGTSAKSVVATFNTATVTTEFNWSSPTYSVNEADGNTIVGRINRSVNTSGAASVYWQTLGITAVDKLDYTGIYPTLVEFADGETFKDVYLTILQDLEVEETETTELRLSSPVNGILGSNYSAILSIVDDDTEAVPVGDEWLPYNNGYIFSWAPAVNDSFPYTVPFTLE